MTTMNRTLVGLIGAFMLTNGLGFWFALDLIAPLYNLSVADPLARAGIRADFGGFFFASGAFATYAAARSNPTAARAAAALFILAITGRFLSVAFDGAAPQGALPMLFEGISAAILLRSAHLWARQAERNHRLRIADRTGPRIGPQTVEA